jgi:hypothetical protein
MSAHRLLNETPSASEVQRVDDLWAVFNSTTQFLAALKQVMLNRDIPNEAAALEQFLPVMAQVEANDLNALVAAQEPITQRAVPK